MRVSNAYKDAMKIQKSLQQMIDSGHDNSAACAAQWIALERLKREMRGIPPLKAHSISELLTTRKPRRAINAPVCIEIPSATNEDSPNPQTVPTPPTP